MLDILITNGYIITLEGIGVGIIEDGAVGIKDDRIVVVGDTSEVIKRYKAHRYIDAENKAVMPGLIDAHIHTGIGLLRGVAQDIDNWMLEGMWPFESKIRLDVEAIKIGSMMNILESLKAGTTTFCDFDTPMDQIVENHYKIGTRARVAELISGLPKDTSSIKVGDLFPIDTEIESGKLKRNLNLINEWHEKDNDRITCLLGPQAPDMVTKSLLLEVKNLSEKMGIGIHMHVSQGARENEQTMKRYGKRSIPFLDEIGYLDESLMAIHLTDATKEETQYLGNSGVGMVICSCGTALLGGKVPPAFEFLEVSDRLALGSDEAPGNNCCNMFNEMKFTSLLNKCRQVSPTVFPAWKVLRMATIEAAKTIGLGDQIGSLEVGKKADIIIIDLMQPALGPIIKYPIRNIVPNLVYSAKGSEVQTVIIDGKIIVDNFEVLTVDEKQIMRDSMVAAKRVCEAAAPEFFKKNTPLYHMMKEGKL